MSNLLIVESPAKAKTIGKYLGSDFVVKASMGHVRDLYPSKLSVDVKKDFEPQYTSIKGKEKVIEELRQAAKKADKVYLGTDPDREGEAISWHLATLLNLNIDTVERVKFNEINKTSVKNEIANPSKIDIDLVNAQQARRILDRIVGYQLSPFLSSKIRKGLSAGRVQSVATKLIVDRENEINAFVPEEYWTIDAKFTASRKVFKASFIGDETGKIKLTDETTTNKYMNRLDGAVYNIANVKNGTRTKQPFAPYITSTLQQDASHKLNFTSKRTMRIAQELYEGVDVEGYGSIGLITYMRTDSTRISDESRKAGNSFIEKNYGKNYLPEKPRVFKMKANAQDGHEAIRPTTVELTPEKARASLTTDQYKLYKLIWNRFIASLMANCIQNTQKIEIHAVGTVDAQYNGEKYVAFSATGYSVKFDGFTKVYEVADEEDETALPTVSVGDTVKVKEIVPNQHFTQPPARYTEASLIKMLEETGVGRPSTYASIISTIIDREYVVFEAKSLKPTELGFVTTKVLEEKFPKIVNTKFTAGMESDLDKVEVGQLDYIKMLHTFYDDFSATLDKAKETMKGVKIQLEEDKTDIPCPNCGQLMIIKVGRFGKFIACPNYPTCKTTMPFVKETGATCPVCGGNVISKKAKGKYVFYGCSNSPNCNFMTWDVPTGENCPECGHSLFKNRSGTVKCLFEGCNYEVKKRSKKNEEK